VSTAASPGPARFTGFPVDAFAFYEALVADNSKVFWQANKARYHESVRAPMEAFLALVDDEFGPFHIFRPYVDVRFSKNKAPYKTHIGAYGESEGGAGFYVQLSAAGLLVAAGYYAMASDQLERFRRAVDDDARGAEVQSLVRSAEKAGYSMGAIGELKTAPRGYPKDHSRIALLRRKGLMGSRTWEPAAWMHTARARERVVGVWRGLADLNAWLDTHVGPSTLPPDDVAGF
jgi:uncharacterized protein (TIGR02453 family)